MNNGNGTKNLENNISSAICNHYFCANIYKAYVSSNYVFDSDDGRYWSKDKKKTRSYKTTKESGRIILPFLFFGEESAVHNWLV